MLCSKESRPTVCVQDTVHCKLGSLQRQTIHNHLKSSRIRDRHVQVHVPHQHVADSSSCLPACPGSHTLQSETTPAQHSPPRTTCTKSNGWPHRQLRTDNGDDARGSRGRGGRNRVPIGRSRCQCRSCSSTCLGAHQCLHLFRHPGEQVLRVSFLHLALASCCQPDRSVPGSKWSGSRSGGRVRNCCFPTGRFKSHDTSELTTNHLCGLKSAPTQRPSALQSLAMCLPNSPMNAGVLPRQQIATRYLPERKDWKQLQPRRPLALEKCGEFCTGHSHTPTSCL